MVDLTTRYLGLELRNPLVVSASPLSDDLQALQELEAAGASAVVMRSLFEEQIEEEALAYHRIIESSVDSFTEAQSYFPGVQEFRTGPRHYVESVETARRTLGIPVIASLNGISPGGWVRYARYMEDAGVDALELNVYFVAANPEDTADDVERRYLELISAVRDVVKIPVSVKVGPFFSSMANMATRLVDAGADGLVLFNRFLQPDINLERLSVEPGIRLSSSAELRLPLRWIAILHGRINASLAATGGVHTAADASKALLAGADVAMMASSLLIHGPQRLRDMRTGLEEWLEENEYESVAQMKGSLSQQSCPDPAAFERAHYMRSITGYKWQREVRNARQRPAPVMPGRTVGRLSDLSRSQPARYEPVGRALQEVQEALRGDFFGRIPATTSARICEGAVHLQVPARETIYWEGEEPHVALVVSGLVRVYIMTPEGRQVTVRYVGPGGVLGLAAAAATGRAPVNVETMRPTKLMLVDRSRVVAEAKNDATVAWAIAEENARRYDEALTELADHPSATVRQRVARHLLLLSEASGRGDGTLLVNFYQQEIADVTGSVREVVARALRSFREEGILTTEPSGGFIIYDPAALQRIASAGI